MKKITITADQEVSVTHHLGCEVDLRELPTAEGLLVMWCPSHEQWLYAFPVARTFHYQGFPDYRR